MAFSGILPLVLGYALDFLIPVFWSDSYAAGRRLLFLPPKRVSACASVGPAVPKLQADPGSRQLGRLQ